MPKKIAIATLLLLLCVVPPPAVGQELLEDQTGDGAVHVMGFGDSITAGVGDGNPPGIEVEEASFPGGAGGYLQRVSAALGISVTNAGSAGEFLTNGGVERFARVATNPLIDVIVILEGTNDAVVQVGADTYSRALQTVVNIARASGKKVILVTLPPTCCNRSAQRQFTRYLSAEVRRIAFINDVRVADYELAFETSCQSQGACEFLNAPEGLHPNTLGYDAFGQLVTATFLEIDLFAPDGAAELESALDLPEGSVVVRPIAEGTAP